MIKSGKEYDYWLDLHVVTITLALPIVGAAMGTINGTWKRVGAFYGAYTGALAWVRASIEVIRLAFQGLIEADFFDVSINSSFYENLWKE